MIIREVSIVSFPAYEQTSVDVAQRSLQAFQQGRRNSIAWYRHLHKQRLVS